MLKRIALTALVAGAIAGFFMWGIQSVKVVPLILQAEVYEEQDAAAPHAHEQGAAAAQHSHEAAVSGEDGWAPADGFERMAFTLLTDLITGIGFAFILVGGIALSGRDITWRQGILWGLAGFAVFYAAPSLGLPPEVPGMQAADLMARQIWWIGTAIATAMGLALAVFSRRPVLVAAGIVLILLPHVVGAPHHEPESGLLPAEIAAQFAVASLVTVELFWMLLGGLTGYFYGRFGRA
jgi:cobalt transporter subunit CbtA